MAAMIHALQATIRLGSTCALAWGVACWTAAMVTADCSAQELDTDAASEKSSIDGDSLLPPGVFRQTQFSATQPAPQTAPQAQPTAPPPRARPATRSSYSRLARVPNMFGDSISPSGQLVGSTEKTPGVALDVPLSGGAGRAKISENDKGLPMDRVYFLFNHFNNALVADENIFAGDQREFDLDRYTLGIEKTFLDERMSLGARVPLLRPFEISEPQVSLSGGEVGNVAVILKALLFANTEETLAVGGGITLDLPTGSDVDTRIGDSELVIRNRSVHVMPFLSALFRPDERWFYQGTLQFDFTANGNPIVYTSPLDDPGSLTSGSFGAPTGTRLEPGILNDQTLMYIDVSAGRWFFINENSSWFRGLAGVVELHYTTTLQNADAVAFKFRSDNFNLTNLANRYDVLNLTAGLHMQVDRLTNVRVGCVVPLRSGFDRAFDSEVQVSVNRFF